MHAALDAAREKKAFMRSSALTGRKLSFAVAVGMVWLAALSLSAAEPPRGGGASSSPAGSSAVKRGPRLAARPAPPPKAGKSSKASKDKPAARKNSEVIDRTKEPTTFAEAFDRGKQSLEECAGRGDGIAVRR